jgi:hypothetical protein
MANTPQLNIRVSLELKEAFIQKAKEQEKALTPEKRDRILAALGVGKQSPQYKRVKAILEQLMT